MLTLCDKCFAPGACCKGFALESGNFCRSMSSNQVMAFLKDHNSPFVPVVMREDDGIWLFECTKLSPEGRCTIYKDRPRACRGLIPASESLCVHYKGESGDPTVDVLADPYEIFRKEKGID